MKTIKVRLKCHMCSKFEVEHSVDTNEHGYFTFPDSFCPECLGLLNVVIDGGINLTCQKK